MKNPLTATFLVLLIGTASIAQKTNDKYLDKVKTLDNTIETFYTVISGSKGEKRNWELFAYLFTEDAKLIPSGKNRQGVNGYRYMSRDDHISSSGKWLEENGFFEKELHRNGYWLMV